MNRQEKINYYLNKTKEYVESLGHTVFVIMLQGSQNYGLDDENSDYDFKCFIIPTFDRLYNRKPISTKYDLEYGQVEVKDAQRFIGLLESMNPSYVEILFTSHYLVNPKFESHYEMMRTIRNFLVEERIHNLSRTLTGMANDKYKNLTKSTPATKAIIEEFGYNPKELHHIARLAMLSRTIDNDYGIDFVPYDRELLMSYKREKRPLEEVERLCQEYIAELEVYKKSKESIPVENGVLNQYEKLIKSAVKKNLKEELS
jgi:predicted nucleotidyltransferase